MITGRPPKYESPKQMQERIDKYFRDCLFNRILAGTPTEEAFNNMATHMGFEGEYKTKTDDQHPTVSGLAVFLDLTRQGLINYEKDYEEHCDFFDTVKKAKARVEAYNEQRLHAGNPAGVIFSLKNNFSWKDKTEVDNTHKFPEFIEVQEIGVPGLEH